ncbi:MULTISPECIES: SPOR domain-containing protein [Peribacillus]|jgi:N-acetylmuramoyl-L-alanine amidase|uniref:SPOR domain-containing protein n=1 Tax=Peribacillus TaxID=2675229 RepID=UPI00107127A8|nr:SPOR domain-containing protein [Peribacillus frigoritolerans]MEC0298408.1 SPOR domain-containing protein [Peribacillus castrilensis]MEC0345236.1 SPOR domain-containing protein [Peribacillus castrilensis]TFH62576.1 SPOR domain-containing protein [Peribacillus frigoritolerans]
MREHWETLSGKKLKEEAKPVEKKSDLHKVQAGAFSDEKNANKLAAELKKKGYSVKYCNRIKSLPLLFFE